MVNGLVVVVPGLLALAAQQLAAMRSLSTLAQLAGAPQPEPRGIAAALFAVLGVDRQTPVAPLALLGAGGEPRDDYVLRADPLHISAERDGMISVRTIDDLSADDAEVLVQMLDRHFAGDDLRFEAPRPDAWFVRRRQPADIATTPPDAVRGRNLLGSMPSGAEGGIWKRWQNEIEMMLHEHPVNAAREARGALAVTGVWFSGGGRLADVGTLPATIVAAPATRAGDLARGIARQAGTTSRSTLDDAEHLMTAAEANRDLLPLAVVAEDLDAKWLAPALARLGRQRLAALQLVADGNGSAATWTARRPRFWQRFAGRATHRAFEIPSPDA